ncbi:hypothetical protein [Janthinobacterium aquaticum]|uniref:hypothetical protein n=1 Tax=Janthinobacterium sp. FT58W TaxID=2654254 RepID=UPI00126452FF|nr:hypothetical protein [Janthinobacterium sp. FT58W]KAB8043152.1 hypothetical protein GCM43_11060 [Janthinobacterium sp. FT58W]
MFNFLVTGADISSPRGMVALGADRVFNYTSADVEEKYAPGGVLDRAALMSIPLVITNESSSDPDFRAFARVGTITKITRGHSEYHIEYALDSDIPPIANDVLESLAPQLNFVLRRKQFWGDFHTNHWAVKDADLFRVLYTEGLGYRQPTVFTLPRGSVDPNLVSVMMPFDGGFNGVFAALENAVSAAGLRCLRADKIWEHHLLIEDVVKLIASARVVICDLTGKNANVFYEAGIAHALGQDVILIAQHESDIPFDLRHIRYVKYLNNEEGLRVLAESVGKRLQSLVSK